MSGDALCTTRARFCAQPGMLLWTESARCGGCLEPLLDGERDGIFIHIESLVRHIQELMPHLCEGAPCP